MIPASLVLIAVMAADPTKAGLVTLDFADRPLAEVVAAISSQSGNSVVMQLANDIENNPRKITLRAAEPVPFWDAIDRFCAETRIQRALNDGGPYGPRNSNVSLYGPGADPGPAFYSGPFRFGKFALHADYRKTYAPSPRSGVEAAEGYRAEFEVLNEPRVLALRTGPLAKLEAVDDAGRSLLEPDAADPAKASGPPQAYALGGYQSAIRVKLATPQPGGKRLKLLKGVMPVEVAIPPKAPTLVVPLSGSVGKTFKTGDLSIKVEEFGAKGDGPTILKVIGKIEGPRGPAGTPDRALVWARCSMIAKSLEVVDAEGRPLQASSATTVGGDESRLTYQAANHGRGLTTSAPKTLRVYAPEWVSWDAPFEFRDVLLP